MTLKIVKDDDVEPLDMRRSRRLFIFGYAFGVLCTAGVVALMMWSRGLLTTCFGH